MKDNARLIVFSGAGLSAESGIPTFRGASGLWNNYKISEVCDISSWQQNREKVHSFYNTLRTGLNNVGPNAAHLRIADWQQRFRTLNLTTNVDDLLQRASCKDVFHLHGSLTLMHCTECGGKWDIGYSDWDFNYPCAAGSTCNSTKGVKPGVTFFGENASKEYTYLAQIIDSLSENDVVLVIGSSCQVLPFHYYLKNKQCLKILNVLSADDEIKHVFDHVFLSPVTYCLDDIENLITQYLS